jgi:hypothetical protein
MFKELIDLPTGDSIHTVQDAQQQQLGGPLNAAVGSLSGMVGVNCNPIAGFIGGNGVNW